MKYISISFLPGSAGNFFSRCLNILNGAHCFVDQQTKQMPETPKDKLDVLGYRDVSCKSFAERNWVNFEKQLVPYSSVRDHFDLPADAYAIWKGHPHHSCGCVDLTTLAGPDDQCFSFYIDPGPHVEWACMNALYKNSFLDVTWFINGQTLLKNPTVSKIQLDNFLKTWLDFYKEIEFVCKIIGHNITPDETQAIERLYYQWKPTILEYKDMENFKQRIGLS